MAPKMGAMLKKAVGHNEKGGKGKLLGFHNTEELMSAIHIKLIKEAISSTNHEECVLATRKAWQYAMNDKNEIDFMSEVLPAVTAAGDAVESEARINACGALFRMASTNSLNRSSLLSAGAVPILLRQAAESVHDLQEVTLPGHIMPPKPSSTFTDTGQQFGGHDPAFGSGTIFVTDCSDATETGLAARFRGVPHGGVGGLSDVHRHRPDVGDSGGLCHGKATIASLEAHMAADRLDDLQKWGARLSLGALALFAMDQEGKNAIEEHEGGIATICRAVAHCTDLVAMRHGLELVCTLCEANECRSIFVAEGLHRAIVDQFVEPFLEWIEEQPIYGALQKTDRQLSAGSASNPASPASPGNGKRGNIQDLPEAVVEDSDSDSDAPDDEHPEIRRLRQKRKKRHASSPPSIEQAMLAAAALSAMCQSCDWDDNAATKDSLGRDGAIRALVALGRIACRERLLNTAPDDTVAGVRWAHDDCMSPKNFRFKYSTAEAAHLNDMEELVAVALWNLSTVASNRAIIVGPLSNTAPPTPAGGTRPPPPPAGGAAAGGKAGDGKARQPSDGLALLFNLASNVTNKSAVYAAAGALANLSVERVHIDLMVSFGLLSDTLVPLISLPTTNTNQDTNGTVSDNNGIRILEYAVSAICMVAALEPHRRTIIDAGALPYLIAALAKGGGGDKEGGEEEGSVLLPEYAGAALAFLTGGDLEVQAMVRVQGGLPPLVSLLKSSNVAHLRYSLLSIWNLTGDKENREVLRGMGALDSLVYAAQHSVDESDPAAVNDLAVGVAGCIWGLALDNSANQAAALAAGVLPHVVGYTASSNTRLQELAVGAVWTLSEDDANKKELVSLGCLEPLLGIMAHPASRRSTTGAFAAGALKSLALDGTNREAISDQGGDTVIRNLLELVDSPDEAAQYQGASTLAGMAIPTANKSQLSNLGAIAVLCGGLQDGGRSPRVQTKMVLCLLNLSVLPANQVAIAQHGLYGKGGPMQSPAEVKSAMAADPFVAAIGHLGSHGLDVLLDKAQHSDHAVVRQYAAATLSNLAMHAANRTLLYKTELRLKGDWQKSVAAIAEMQQAGGWDDGMQPGGEDNGSARSGMPHRGSDSGLSDSGLGGVGPASPAAPEQQGGGIGREVTLDPRDDFLDWVENGGGSNTVNGDSAFLSPDRNTRLGRLTKPHSHSPANLTAQGGGSPSRQTNSRVSSHATLPPRSQSSASLHSDGGGSGGSFGMSEAGVASSFGSSVGGGGRKKLPRLQRSMSGSLSSAWNKKPNLKGPSVRGPGRAPSPALATLNNAGAAGGRILGGSNSMTSLAASDVSQSSFSQTAAGSMAGSAAAGSPSDSAMPMVRHSDGSGTMMLRSSPSGKSLVSINHGRDKRRARADGERRSMLSTLKEDSGRHHTRVSSLISTGPAADRARADAAKKSAEEAEINAAMAAARGGTAGSVSGTSGGVTRAPTAASMSRPSLTGDVDSVLAVGGGVGGAADSGGTAGGSSPLTVPNVSTDEPGNVQDDEDDAGVLVLLEPRSDNNIFNFGPLAGPARNDNYCAVFKAVPGSRVLGNNNGSPGSVTKPTSHMFPDGSCRYIYHKTRLHQVENDADDSPLPPPPPPAPPAPPTAPPNRSQRCTAAYPPPSFGQSIAVPFHSETSMFGRSIQGKKVMVLLMCQEAVGKAGQAGGHGWMSPSLGGPDGISHHDFAVAQLLQTMNWFMRPYGTAFNVMTKDALPYFMTDIASSAEIPKSTPAEITKLEKWLGFEKPKISNWEKCLSYVFKCADVDQVICVCDTPPPVPASADAGTAPPTLEHLKSLVTDLADTRRETLQIPLYLDFIMVGGQAEEEDGLSKNANGGAGAKTHKGLPDGLDLLTALAEHAEGNCRHVDEFGDLLSEVSFRGIAKDEPPPPQTDSSQPDSPVHAEGAAEDEATAVGESDDAEAAAAKDAAGSGGEDEGSEDEEGGDGEEDEDEEGEEGDTGSENGEGEDGAKKKKKKKKKKKGPATPPPKREPLPWIIDESLGNLSLVQDRNVINNFPIGFASFDGVERNGDDWNMKRSQEIDADADAEELLGFVMSQGKSDTNHVTVRLFPDPPDSRPCGCLKGLPLRPFRSRLAMDMSWHSYMDSKDYFAYPRFMTGLALHADRLSPRQYVTIQLPFHAAGVRLEHSGTDAAVPNLLVDNDGVPPAGGGLGDLMDGAAANLAQSLAADSAAAAAHTARSDVSEVGPPSDVFYGSEACTLEPNPAAVADGLAAMASGGNSFSATIPCLAFDSVGTTKGEDFFSSPDASAETSDMAILRTKVPVLSLGAVVSFTVNIPDPTTALVSVGAATSAHRPAAHTADDAVSWSLTTGVVAVGGRSGCAAPGESESQDGSTVKLKHLVEMTAKNLSPRTLAWGRRVHMQLVANDSTKAAATATHSLQVKLLDGPDADPKLDGSSAEWATVCDCDGGEDLHLFVAMGPNTSITDLVMIHSEEAGTGAGSKKYSKAGSGVIQSTKDDSMGDVPRFQLSKLRFAHPAPNVVTLFTVPGQSYYFSFYDKDGNNMFAFPPIPPNQEEDPTFTLCRQAVTSLMSD